MKSNPTWISTWYVDIKRVQYSKYAFPVGISATMIALNVILMIVVVFCITWIHKNKNRKVTNVYNFEIPYFSIFFVFFFFCFVQTKIQIKKK